MLRVDAKSGNPGIVSYAEGLNNGNAWIDGPFIIETANNLTWVAEKIRNPEGNPKVIGVWLMSAGDGFQQHNVAFAGEHRWEVGDIKLIERVIDTYTDFTEEHTIKLNWYMIERIYHIGKQYGYTNAVRLAGEMGASEWMLHARADRYIGIVAFVRPIDNAYAYVLSRKPNGEVKMYDGSFHYWPDNGHFSIS